MSQFSANKPYNELPLLPPKGGLETRAVLKLCIEARAELATLKQLGDSLPNQAVLINTLPLLEQLFVQPFCRIANLVDSGIAKRQTASVYLKQLRDIDILEEHKVGREKLFLYTRFLALLTDDSRSVRKIGISQ